jgi:enterochelin esterase family protein
MTKGRAMTTATVLPLGHATWNQMSGLFLPAKNNIRLVDLLSCGINSAARVIALTNGTSKSMQTLRLLPKLLRSRIVVSSVLIVLAGLLNSSTPLPASSVDSLSIDSEALGRKLAVSVYVPGSRAPEGGWPVLYLLHGLGGCETDWVEFGGLQATLDRLIEAGRVRPMMVVMPGAGSSWYVDSGALGGPGNYESAIGQDLPRAIEARYPVADSPEFRAIAGVSMGGYGALRIALRSPERYTAVASMSGALWQNLPVVHAAASGVPYDTVRDTAYFHRIDDATIVQGIDLPPQGSHFGKAFGAPFDAERFNRQNVFTLLARQITKNTSLPSIFLTVGDHDSKNLWRGSIALYQTLRADQRDVEFRVTDGDHTWSLWKKSIEDTLLFIDSRFGSKPATTVAESGLKAAS